MVNKGITEISIVLQFCCTPSKHGMFLSKSIEPLSKGKISCLSRVASKVFIQLLIQCQKSFNLFHVSPLF